MDFCNDAFAYARLLALATSPASLAAAALALRHVGPGRPEQEAVVGPARQACRRVTARWADGRAVLTCEPVGG